MLTALAGCQTEDTSLLTTNAVNQLEIANAPEKRTPQEAIEFAQSYIKQGSKQEISVSYLTDKTTASRSFALDTIAYIINAEGNNGFARFQSGIV